MPVFAISNCWNYQVIHQCEAGSWREMILQAFALGISLRDANLTDADLSRADLSRADLSDADLSRANLSGANLTDADLSRADLTDANLTDANLSRADLSDANLSDANLTLIRSDFQAVLASVPSEVPALRDALVAGKVDGSAYKGECACLVGTIANARHCPYDAIPGLAPDSSRPAERFFLAIRKGDTPENSQFVARAVSWIDEFTTEHATTARA